MVNFSLRYMELILELIVLEKFKPMDVDNLAAMFLAAFALYVLSG